MCTAQYYFSSKPIFLYIFGLLQCSHLTFKIKCCRNESFALGVHLDAGAPFKACQSTQLSEGFDLWKCCSRALLWFFPMEEEGNVSALWHWNKKLSIITASSMQRKMLTYSFNNSYIENHFVSSGIELLKSSGEYLTCKPPCIAFTSQEFKSPGSYFISQSKISSQWQACNRFHLQWSAFQFMAVLHYVCLISTGGLVGGEPAKCCWMMITCKISRGRSIYGTGYQKQKVNHFHFVTQKTKLHCFLSVVFAYVWLNQIKLPSGVLGFCKRAWYCCNSLAGPAGHVLLLAHLWHCRALCRTPVTTCLVCDSALLCHPLLLQDNLWLGVLWCCIRKGCILLLFSLILSFCPQNWG